MAFVQRARLGRVSAVLMAMSLTIAASGGTVSRQADAAGSGPAAATARLLAAEGVPAFTLKTMLGKKVKSGQTAYYISVLLGIPFSQQIIKGFKAGLTAVGDKVTTVDANGSTVEAARLMQQAVNQHVGAIVIQSISSSQLLAPIQAARAAGIPVIEMFQANPRLPTAQESAAGVKGMVSFDFAEAGRLQADWAIADSKGAADVVVIQSPDSGVAKPQVDGIISEFTKNCPACKVKVMDVLQADWATRIPTLTDSILRDPKVNYILPIYDSMATYITPEVSKFNAQNRVKVASINADVPQMKQLKNHDVIGALVGQPLNWLGWATADQTIRLMNGVAPVADEGVALRVFAANNITSVNINADQGTWFGKTDYQTDYKHLWGVM